MEHFQEQQDSPAFEFRILLLGLIFILSGILYIITFGVSSVSFILFQNLNITFTKWCSILVVPIIAIILLFLKKKKSIPYIIACIWFISTINILSFLTSSSWSSTYGRTETVIDIYNTARFFGFSAKADVLKGISLIIAIYFTYYIATSKYIKHTFK